MSHLKISYDDYIVINDGQVTSEHLPKNVSFDDHTLKFTLGAPIALHVVLIMSKDYELTYEFGAHTHAEIIETRAINDEAKLTRTINAQEEANVQFFNENMSNSHHKLTFIDQGNIDAYAHVEMGYAELSDDSIEANYHYHLTGVEASMKLRMAILSKEAEKKHYTINLEHNAPHTTGIMDNYGVAKDTGRLVIDGIGTIKKAMKGSESHQTNKIMVFDQGCYASANPYLFIDEYDVAASHAAAVGRMDEEHLYYLESRGLTKRDAMQLITYGYLKPVINVVDNDMLKERFEEALTKVGA